MLFDGCIQRVKVKICGVRDQHDLRTVVDSGADAAGFLVGQRFVSEDFVDPAWVAAVVPELPATATPVLVTHLNDHRQILALVKQTKVLTLQLHGEPTVAQVRQLRRELPSAAKILVALHVVRGEVERTTDMFAGLADALVLDTALPEVGRIGGTGRPHDWQVSRRLTDGSSLPMVLAGGLTPENVAAAIRLVRPWGVDVNSGVEDAAGRKSPERCQAFVEASHQAGRDLP